MSSAAESLATAIKLVHTCETAASHQLEERGDQAWEALKKATPLLKKEAGALQLQGQEDRLAVWKFTAARALKKRLIKGQCKASLAILANDVGWLHTATSNEELLAQLRELFADNPEMLAKFTPPSEEELAARAKEAAAAPKVKIDPTILEHAADKVKAAWVSMAGFDFIFPVDPLGTKSDDGCDAMQLFYQGVLKLSARELDWMTKEDFGKFLQFSQGMAEQRTASQPRIRFAVRKVTNLRPELQNLAADFLVPPVPAPLEPPPTPAPAVPPPMPASAPGAEGHAHAEDREQTETSADERTMPVVFWVDFKKEAYEGSDLWTHPEVVVLGFHDDETAADFKPQEEVTETIREHIGKDGFHVAALVVNRRHEQMVRNILEYCKNCQAQLPKVIVVTRPSAVVDLSSWGVQDDLGFVVTRWLEVAPLVLGSGQAASPA